MRARPLAPDGVDYGVVRRVSPPDRARRALEPSMEPIAPSTCVVVLAYIDPGLGSILLQVLVGGGVAAAFFFKNTWRRIGGFISSLGGGGRPPVASRGPGDDAPDGAPAPEGGEPDPRTSPRG